MSGRRICVDSSDSYAIYQGNFYESLSRMTARCSRARNARRVQIADPRSDKNNRYVIRSNYIYDARFLYKYQNLAYRILMDRISENSTHVDCRESRDESPD